MPAESEVKSRGDPLSKSIDSSAESRRVVPDGQVQSANGNRSSVSALGTRPKGKGSLGRRPRSVVTPKSGVSKSSLGFGFRQPPLYHISNYPERMPKARAELARLGGMLDGLLGELRISANELKSMEESAMIYGSFSPEKVQPDHFVDPDDGGQVDLAFDAIVTELVRQAVVKVDRIGKSYRMKLEGLEASARKRKKEKEKYKSLAMCADEHEQHYIDEIAKEPYRDIPIHMLKQRLKTADRQIANLIKEVKERDEKLGQYQVKYSDLHHDHQSNKKELVQLQTEKKDLIPKKFMDIVTEQCQSYVAGKNKAPNLRIH